MKWAGLITPLIVFSLSAAAQVPERRSNLDGLYGRSPEFQNRRQGPTQMQQQPQRRGGIAGMYDENGRLRPDRQRYMDQQLNRAYGPGAAEESRRIQEFRERDIGRMRQDRERGIQR